MPVLHPFVHFTEMATDEARGSEHIEPAHPMGAPHQGDRVPLRVRGGLVLHLPSVAILGQPGHRLHTARLRHCA